VSDDRIKCLVPFCKRTARADKYPGQDIICGKCWRYVSPKTKLRRALLNRRSRKVNRLFRRRATLQKPAFAEQASRLEELFKEAWGRNWAACLREATDGRLGIGGSSGTSLYH
jgi:hypothetical protein